MQNIQELLEFKGTSEVQMVGPNDTVFDAVTRMVELNIGAVLVEENNVIEGGGWSWKTGTREGL